MSDILAASSAADWRALDPNNTLLMELPKGRVVIELAPDFAPKHAANIRALVREGYFDGAFILRSQDNYVVQWGWPEETPRKVKKAHATEKAEFFRAVSADLPYTPLPDLDTYAATVGFSSGFPAARDAEGKSTWLVHCYAMLGAGRGDTADSGGGTELYAVNGHSPRHLDKNVTLVGRVVQGMELLSVMPRGTGALGFYETAAERTAIKSVRLEADVPAAERANLEALKTERATFVKLIDARRVRRESWFLDPSGHLGVCNMPLPVRKRGG
ncbi:MAG: peptidylprolyl isomerase [Alphaproteobacteria bacterium]